MSPPRTNPRAWLSAASLGARRQLRGALWPIIQASIAAGLAWYITHNLLGRPSPFFAPIAAAVALSANGVLRGQRAVQLVGGVALGIVVGVGAEQVGGTGPIAVGAAVAVSLALAVVIGRGVLGQGLMFVNQTSASAILVIALHNAGTGSARLVDALIGGGVALLVGLVLFPTSPIPLVVQATRSVLLSMHGALVDVEQAIADGDVVEATRALAASRRIHESLAGMTQALASAREIVRWAPRRWSSRPAVRRAEARSSALDQLADSVLSVMRAGSAAMRDDRLAPAPLREAIGELAAGLDALAKGEDTREATVRASQAGCLTEEVTTGDENSAAMVASIVRTCADDLARLAREMTDPGERLGQSSAGHR